VIMTSSGNTLAREGMCCSPVREWGEAGGRRTVGDVCEGIDEFCDIGRDNVVLSQIMSTGTWPHMKPTKDKEGTSSQKLFSLSQLLLYVKTRGRGITSLQNLSCPSTACGHVGGMTKRATL
jgi:hypothetical protein